MSVRQAFLGAEALLGGLLEGLLGEYLWVLHWQGVGGGLLAGWGHTPGNSQIGASLVPCTSSLVGPCSLWAAPWNSHNGVHQVSLAYRVRPSICSLQTLDHFGELPWWQWPAVLCTLPVGWGSSQS